MCGPAKTNERSVFTTRTFVFGRSRLSNSVGPFAACRLFRCRPRLWSCVMFHGVWGTLLHVYSSFFNVFEPTSLTTLYCETRGDHMSAEISVLISTTLSKGTEVPRARSPAHSLTHSLTVHLFTHSSCSTLSGATRTRTCRCCSAAACRLVPRACPVARTSSRGLHRAALMHHFLSDACRVCLAGSYGHMPSDKTIGPPPTVVTVRTQTTIPTRTQYVFTRSAPCRTV